MKTVIEMAREAQMPFYWCTEGIPYLDKLERFAELVRADEREACARVAERSESALHCAAAIRARGQV